MNPVTEFLFPGMAIALGANLRRVILVDFGKIHTTLPAYPLQNIEKLSKASV